MAADEQRAKPKVERSVSQPADDPKRGMTLDELAVFVQAAMRAEIPGDTIVKSTATWRSTIKKLEISG